MFGRSDYRLSSFRCDRRDWRRSPWSISTRPTPTGRIIAALAFIAWAIFGPVPAYAYAPMAKRQVLRLELHMQLEQQGEDRTHSNDDRGHRSRTGRTASSRTHSSPDGVFGRRKEQPSIGQVDLRQ